MPDPILFIHLAEENVLLDVKYVVFFFFFFLGGGGGGGGLVRKVSKGANIRNRYNQVPHLTQDTNGKVINSQLDTINESQEASPFPAGDRKAQINRRAQRRNTHKT